jgi:probable HAF family extracellular repeat protein
MCAGASFCAPAPLCAAPGDVYTLGSFGPGTRLTGRKMNNAGQVAGDADLGGIGIPPFRAFRFTPVPGGPGLLEDIGTFGGRDSVGLGINDAGQVTGWSGENGKGGHAFRYTGAPGRPGVMEDLGVLPGATLDNSVGYAINNAGQVTGYSRAPHPVERRAFRYTGTPGAGGFIQDLGTLDTFYGESWGLAINSAGQVVGNSGGRAFLYTDSAQGGRLYDLGSLGGGAAGAAAINDAGEIAGGSLHAGAFEPHAFRYTGTPGAGGTMTDLGTLGGAGSTALGINNHGVIAGMAQHPDAQRSAVLWRADNTIVDLDAWLDEVNPEVGRRWVLDFAYDVNDRGLVMGNGMYNDGPGGLPDGPLTWVLDASAVVPEPGAAAFYIAATAALLLRRARRRVGEHTR